MPFDQNIHPMLLRALSARNYGEPTPVQEAVSQPDAAGRDLLVSAQTGSGKTVAYGVAIGETLLAETERFGRAAKPLALVVAPTRELALQVQRELAWLYAEASGRVIACVGGMDIRREQRTLAAGAHIVVGTPGRLADHLDQGHLDLQDIRVVVLDEADEMLDFGFREELETLLNATPEDRRTLLFSATLPKAILGLAKQYQRDALRLALTSEHSQHDDIEYRALRIAPRDIEHAVVNTLRYHDSPGALVFCATREAVRHLHANLQERGFAAVALSGELKQSERTAALQALRDGRARVCVATDVAARGLDMPDLGLVIHADLPENRQALLHRSGRTGRAGRKGTSVILVPAQRRAATERLLASAKIRAVWAAAPSAEVIRAKDEANLVSEILAMSDASAEDDLAAARALLEQSSAEQLVAVLVRLRREALPAPEVLEDPGKYKKPAYQPKKKFWPGARTFSDKRSWQDRGPAQARDRKSRRPKKSGASSWSKRDMPR